MRDDPLNYDTFSAMQCHYLHLCVSLSFRFRFWGTYLSIFGYQITLFILILSCFLNGKVDHNLNIRHNEKILLIFSYNPSAIYTINVAARVALLHFLETRTSTVWLVPLICWSSPLLLHIWYFLFYYCCCWYQCLLSCCSMTETDPSFLYLVITSFMFAELDLGTMSLTYSSYLGMIVTSFMTASSCYCSMSPTYSSFHGMVGTSLTVAFQLCTMSPTYSFFLCIVCTSFILASSDFCTMSWTNWFVHPSWLHRFIIAPCLIHTPPFWTWLVHPSRLHRLIIAPCLRQTPPFWTWLVHPLWLHIYVYFFFCVLHVVWW